MNCQLLADEISKLELTDAALVDCTAADSVVAAYPDFVRANLHIITPNKRANVLPWRRVRRADGTFAIATEIFSR